MISENESMKPQSLAWLSEIPKLDSLIRTVHLIECKDSEYVVVDHAGRDDLTDFYGTEERIHRFLTLAPAVVIGSSGTINDVVGRPEVVSVLYEKVIIVYLPINEHIIAISLSRDAYPRVEDISRKITQFATSSAAQGIKVP